MRTSPGEDARRLVQESGLPEPIRRHLLATVAGAGLRPAEQVDVARELVAHFEDALGSGRDVESLLREFGESDAAARLIRTGKRSGHLRRAATERVGARGDSIVFVILRDLRYALRRMRQSPGFTALAILSLALGVGANTAIFSIVNRLVLRDLPFERPDELVSLYVSTEEFPATPMSYPDYEDLRDGTRDLLADISAFNLSYVSLERSDGVQSVAIEAVSGSYFAMRGLHPAAGRLISREDDRADGASPVAVLEYGTWKREYGGDPSVVGTELRLSGRVLTIIGVAPPDYAGMMPMIDIALFVPQHLVDVLEDSGDSRFEARRTYSTFVTGRLAPGVSLEQLRSAIDAASAGQRERHPDIWRDDVRFFAVPTRDVILFPGFDSQLELASWLLLAVVGLVLLIACANLASFLLARAVDRRREIAIRLSLGATRGKLVGQLLVETVLLALAGGAAGVLLAAWSLSALGRMELPLPVPMDLAFGLDLSVLAFALAVSVLAGIAFGLMPALQATRPDIVGVLRDESAGAGQATRLRLRRALVVVQVAVSVVLLACAGLFLRSLDHVSRLDPGFGAQPTAIVSMLVPQRVYDEAAALAALRDLEREVASLPGVLAVGIAGNLQLEALNTNLIEIRVDGVAAPPGREGHGGDWSPVDAGYFAAAGVPVLAGRAIEESDTADSEPVAVVSAEMARRFWGGDAAVGQTFRDRSGTEITIVGIAADTAVRTLGEEPRLFVYRPLAQQYQTGLSLLASTTGDARALLLSVLAAVRQRMPEAAVYQLRTMDQHLAIVRFPARVTAWLFGAFAALALALATIGLYGTISYAQARRVREVGIRMSLGADAGDVVRMLLRSGMGLAGVGIGIGLLAALMVTRILGGLLQGVGASDPATFGAVLTVIGVVAFLASWLPARRATSISPVEALRSE